MKRRLLGSAVTDEQEQRAADELRQALRQADLPPEHVPSETYWSNLLVHTNERIDHATSGKAISLSWAARVALPGIITIVFFFVALRYYYEPGQSGSNASLVAVVASLPGGVIDSLAVQATSSGLSVPTADLDQSFMQPSDDQLADYLIARGNFGVALEAMEDEQIREVLATLGSQQVQL
jgi:hypothetical protein